MRVYSLALLLVGVSHALVTPSTKHPWISTTALSSSKDLVLQTDKSNVRSKLASAFAALDETDQYDAVLTGLCAKILDETPKVASWSALQDPMALLKEMNARRVSASGRSMMALIDAAVKTEKAGAMAGIMSLSLRNGALNKFGALQSTITTIPSSPFSRVTLPDGTKKTRQERLATLSDIPTDDRVSEITSAMTVAGFCGLATLANVFGIDDVTPWSNVALSGVLTVGLVDNCYDALKFGAKLAKSDLNLPEKIPFNLGTGQVTGTVVRGLSRLVSVDTERECQCEAAAFFAAYSLGLPCFAFRPNALEAAVMVVESMRDDSEETKALDPLLSNVGIMKLLVWLMAPVAMESSKHAQLIFSDPREAMGLLKRLEERADLVNGDLWFAGNEDEKRDLLKWAYAEADLLLRRNKDTVKELSERLAGGAATMGDCVAVTEKW